MYFYFFHFSKNSFFVVKKKKKSLSHGHFGIVGTVTILVARCFLVQSRLRLYLTIWLPARKKIIALSAPLWAYCGRQLVKQSSLALLPVDGHSGQDIPRSWTNEHLREGHRQALQGRQGHRRVSATTLPVHVLTRVSWQFHSRPWLYVFEQCRRAVVYPGWMQKHTYVFDIGFVCRCLGSSLYLYCFHVFRVLFP